MGTHSIWQHSAQHTHIKQKCSDDSSAILHGVAFQAARGSRAEVGSNARSAGRLRGGGRAERRARLRRREAPVAAEETDETAAVGRTDKGRHTDEESNFDDGKFAIYPPPHYYNNLRSAHVVSARRAHLQYSGCCCCCSSSGMLHGGCAVAAAAAAVAVVAAAPWHGSCV